MPLRRPLGDGVVVNYVRLCLAFLVLAPWLVKAQQQLRPAVQQQSPPENLVTTIPKIETAQTQSRNRISSVEKNNKRRINNDASAITTLAPAESAVAAPPVRLSSRSTGVISPPHSARSLEDWEVEDFVLLATVDGKLHGVDRKTGKDIWEPVVSETPMVETIYYRRNRSGIQDDYGPSMIDNYIWAIEPSRDGAIYIYRPDGPNPGLVNTNLTMKRLVEEMSPSEDDDMNITYNGKKETTLFKFDAGNGKVRTWFGSSNTIVNEANCLNTNRLVDKEDDECKTNATFTLGRTEYSVTISGTTDNHLIATLKFSEWVPNNYDNDLLRQYHKTLDNNYIFSRHDGLVIGTELGEDGKTIRQRFNQKLDSPVARVFDVARPWGSEEEDHKLIVLPQPTPPQPDDDHNSADLRARNIFLNHTESGSWYAMSGKFYPGVLHGGIGLARSEQNDWHQYKKDHAWSDMSDKQQNSVLVGLHSIENHRRDGFLTLPSPPQENQNSVNVAPENSPTVFERSALEQLQEWPTLAANSVSEFILNPWFLVLAVSLVVVNWAKIMGYKNQLLSEKQLEKPIEEPALPARGDVVTTTIDEKPVVGIPPTDLKPIDLQKKLPDVPIPTIDVDETQNPVKLKDMVGDLSPNEPQASPAGKKRHPRGKRGGKKHVKGKERSSSQSGSQDPAPSKTLDELVEAAKNLGTKNRETEPDIRTRPNDPSDVSSPILRVGGRLEINQDRRIGNGSNGTLVYEGTFDGRPVAVKRMLIQFFDIASQETRLLRESDDHPNVIRYFTQEHADDFLYIALELCPASLADVIDRPQNHPELARGGEKDLPNVLYQITNGLSHLHRLRIVHRDLKPQNILVNVDKDGKPRLLVSDFGLCKKLDGEQSSFRATTAHAAGTSGWRAPELLLDDDANHGTPAVLDASTNGDSGSGPLISPDLLPHRRATRAIDIFSLGLVFFYVLTKGSHPFDRGGHYMREINIRKGEHDLQKLEVLGDYAYEARELIESMLNKDPKRRPSAADVMSHPFFWPAKKRLNFLVDVSDYFEKEPRDPMSEKLQELERHAANVCRGDFLKYLGKDFVESLGKQRKYTGTRLLDLLRALRNKKNHYEDLSDQLKEKVGPLPDGYLSFFTRKFPDLLITCWNVVYENRDDQTDRFRDYYGPAML